ncbi:MAG: L-rhamnose mutarotase [Chloroflexi bacterium]|jgi:L-rhamnose mutarotase|nr:L-rhamnose mutarotase [Chloroflexota bacterium]
MHRMVWKAYVNDIEEYKKRHDEIWPEMTAMLNEAGIHNYSIWNVGDELFAYLECHIDLEESMRIQRESEVAKRWAKHMEGILRPAEKGGHLTQVFFHE